MAHDDPAEFERDWWQAFESGDRTNRCACVLVGNPDPKAWQGGGLCWGRQARDTPYCAGCIDRHPAAALTVATEIDGALRIDRLGLVAFVTPDER